MTARWEMTMDDEVGVRRGRRAGSERAGGRKVSASHSIEPATVQLGTDRGVRVFCIWREVGHGRWWVSEGEGRRPLGRQGRERTGRKGGGAAGELSCAFPQGGTVDQLQTPGRRGSPNTGSSHWRGRPDRSAKERECSKADASSSNSTDPSWPHTLGGDRNSVACVVGDSGERE